MKNLSVIIPAYKQETTILRDIQTISNTLEEMNIDYEVIVVVDGFVDSSFELAKTAQSSKIHVLGYQKNHGKGYAIRYGIAHSNGEFVAFIDAGGDIDPDGLKVIFNLILDRQADVVIGSKRHKESKVKYPLLRRTYSFVYQFLLMILFGLQVRDTQVGLKIFRREVLESILPRLLVERFAIDLEMLVVMRHLGYKKVMEAPVQITYQFQSSINIKAILNVIKDTMSIFYRMNLTGYYDEKNAQSWKTDSELLLDNWDRYSNRAFLSEIATVER